NNVRKKNTRFTTPVISMAVPHILDMKPLMNFDRNSSNEELLTW
ncbi:unnamed protein product, partial [marine sediment metagenome]